MEPEAPVSDSSDISCTCNESGRTELCASWIRSYTRYGKSFCIYLDVFTVERSLCMSVEHKENTDVAGGSGIWKLSCIVPVGAILQSRRNKSQFLCGGTLIYRCLFWFVCLCTPEKHQMEDLLYMGGQPLDHRAGVKWQLCTECKGK